MIKTKKLIYVGGLFLLLLVLLISTFPNNQNVEAKNSETYRQLTLFEDESVRSSAGNASSVNPGNRLFNDPNPETSDITKSYIC